MIGKIPKDSSHTRAGVPADNKHRQMLEKRGVASNRQGIRYGARQAGRANEHFEQKIPKDSTMKSKYGGRKPAHKTHEQRITK